MLQLLVEQGGERAEAAGVQERHFVGSGVECGYRGRMRLQGSNAATEAGVSGAVAGAGWEAGGGANATARGGGRRRGDLGGIGGEEEEEGRGGEVTDWSGWELEVLRLGLALEAAAEGEVVRVEAPRAAQAGLHGPGVRPRGENEARTRPPSSPRIKAGSSFPSIVPRPSLPRCLSVPLPPAASLPWPSRSSLSSLPWSCAVVCVRVCRLARRGCPGL